MNGVTKFLEEELGLKVHPTKSKVVNVMEIPFTFLGYEFYRTDIRRIDPKKEEKFKKRIKEITRRNQTVNIQTLIKEELNPYLRGWANYFKYGNVKTKFRKYDSWIRRRLRMVQLRSWRKVGKLHTMLRKKGWGEHRLVGLPMRKWRSSKCQMIDGALDIKFFQNIKLVNLITIYDERYL